MVRNKYLSMRLFVLIFCVGTFYMSTEGQCQSNTEDKKYNSELLASILKNDEFDPKVVLLMPTQAINKKMGLLVSRMKEKCDFCNNIRKISPCYKCDGLYFDKQLTDTSLFEWPKEMFNNWTVLDSNTFKLLNDTNQSFNADGFYVLYKPVFSADFEFAVINVLFFKHNELSKGSFRIYQKAKDAYVFKGEFCNSRR